MNKKRDFQLPPGMHLLSENTASFDLRIPAGAPVQFKTHEQLLSAKDFKLQSIEDIIPRDDDYIFPRYRAISARYLGENGYFLDFSETGILKDSLKFFLSNQNGGERLDNLKFVMNHSTSLERIIGVIVEAEFVEKNDKFDSAGIDVTAKVDSVLFPQIARGLLSEPPLFDNVSISFTAHYRRSHPDMKVWAFYDMLGEEFEGEIVRIIVDEILRVRHLGLVDAGADEHAKKLNAATSSWPPSKGELNDGTKYFYTETKEKTMKGLQLDEKQVAELARVLGVDEIDDGDELIQNVTAVMETLDDNKTTLKEAKQKVGQVEKLLESKRDQVIKILAKNHGGTAPHALENAVNKMSLSELEEFEAEQQETFDKMFPLTCQDCGKKNLKRRASREEQPGHEPGDNSGKVEVDPADYFI